MKDDRKTKKQLLDEMGELRRRLAALEGEGGPPRRRGRAPQEKGRTTGDKNAERQREIDHLRLLSAFDGIEGGVYVSDPETHEVLYANQAVRATFGDVVGQKCYRTLQSQEFPCPFCSTEYIAGENSGKTHRWEYQNQINRRWHECFDREIPWPDGRLVHHHIFFDVTERKRTEEALRSSEESLRALVEASPDAIGVTDTRGYFTYVSEASVRLHGFTRAEEMIGINSFELVAPENHPQAVKNMERALREGSVRNTVYTLLKKDGSRFIGELNSSLIRDDQGNPKAFITVVRDISERVRATEALRDSEKKYRDLVDHSLIGIYRTSLQGDFLYANQALAEIGEYASPGEMIKAVGGKVVTLYKNPGDRKVLLDALKKSGQVEGFEIDILTSTGKTKHVILSAVLDGAVLDGPVLSGMIKDITKRTHAEKALRESEEKFKSLAEQSPNMIFINVKGKVVYANRSSTQCLGYTLDEFLAPDFDFRSLIAPDDLEKVREIYTQHLSGREVPPYEYGLITKEGREIQVINSTKLILYGGEPAILGIVTDITDRKLAEKKLQESESRFRSFTQNFNGIIYQGDLEFKPLFFSGAVKRITGYREEEFIEGGKTWDRIVHPDDFQSLLTGEAEKIRTVPNFSTERKYRIIHKDGSTHWVQEVIQNLCDDSGKPVLVQGILHDITGRERVESALWESQARYRNLYQDSRDAIYITSRDGRFVDVNRATLDLFGYSRDEMIGMDTQKIYCRSNDWKKFQEEIGRLGHVKDYEVEFCRKDGGKIDCLLSSSVRRAADGSVLGYQGIIHDVTERRKRTEEFLKIEKLESLGILAGGIAHDFNNLLTAILGHISLAMMHLKPGDEPFKGLHEAERASLRAKDLTTQLLTLAKGESPVMQTIHLAGLVRESAELTQHGSNVKCNFNLPEDLWPVDVDEGQMGQGIHNLTINAIQAMPEGGTVYIRAENIIARARQILPLRDGRYVKISVQDHGVGMPREVVSKIFDPYFTTKERGSGLGLAVTHSAVQRHGGHLTVETELGEGTTFHIYLPASDKDTVPADSVKEKPVTGEGKVLIMDDDEMVRKVAREILSQSGYGVETVEDGAEAVERYRQEKESGAPFDVVIMDLTIPGKMGGKEAIRKLLKYDPGVKAIVSSGYSFDPVMAEYKEYGFVDVLRKPYKSTDLSRVVRRVVTSCSD